MKVTDWDTLCNNHKDADKLTSHVIRDEVTRELLMDYPIYFHSLVAIKYDTRSTTYVGRFHGSLRTGDGDDSTLKLTNEVARFLLAHRMIHSRDPVRHFVPEMFLKMNADGAVCDCVLVTISARR